MNDLLGKAKQYFGNKDGTKKLLKKETCVLLLLFGILFMVIQLPVGGETTSGIPKKSESVRQLYNVDEYDFWEERTEYQNAIETRMEQILSKMNGVGNVAVMVTLRRDDGFEMEREGETNVEGVFIVAEGGDNPEVNLQITEACQALFGISAHKIVIVKGNALERRTE